MDRDTIITAILDIDTLIDYCGDETALELIELRATLAALLAED